MDFAVWRQTRRDLDQAKPTSLAARLKRTENLPTEVSLEIPTPNKPAK
jgi:hypothetical protein